MNSHTRIVADYQAACSINAANSLAQAIAFEQTVEMAQSAIRDPLILEQIVGRVEQVEYRNQKASIRISYNPDLAEAGLGQLLNLAYGSVSLYPGIRLTRLEIPDPAARRIGGPRFGVSGIRQAAGNPQRPLLCTVLKPRGCSTDKLAQLAYQFSAGGGDIVKDDQNLGEADCGAFKSRVSACWRAIQRGCDSSGKTCLYFPHVGGAGEDLQHRLDWLQSLDIPGALLCPMVIGLETAKILARESGLMYMAHPLLAGAFTHAGNHGIAAPVLLGLLYRLGGADISIFPGPGGRIALSSEDSLETYRQLTRPLDNLLPSLPATGGGKSLASIPQIRTDYGRDIILIAGGALQTLSADVTANTRTFITALEE